MRSNEHITIKPLMCSRMPMGPGWHTARPRPFPLMMVASRVPNIPEWPSVAKCSRAKCTATL